MKRLFLFLAISMFLFQSCEKDPISQNPEGLTAPQLPPTSMFSLPESTLENAEAGKTEFDTKWNFLHAGLNYLGWTAIVVTNMAVPVKAFGMAFNEEAEFVGDNTFEWKYNYNDTSPGGANYAVSLTGQYINNAQEVEWKLTVDRQGAYSNFVWYSGIVATDLSYGAFTLNQKPNNPETLIAISYDKDLSTQDVSLRFTNAISGDAGNGNYVEYRTEVNEYFNRSFDVQLGEDDLLEIQYNDPSGNGHVRHPKHFNNSEWHCWDNEQIDVDC